ncbi:MAG: hypothetical protein LBP53_04565 [Candidatus Peribacteria bacterium]|jgi:hypothetical protein|nr:hypothetical protein [Candidatus Peribacteria bacterium]
MVCVFKVYNGKEMQSKGDSIYEIEVPCFTKGTDIQYDWEKSNLIKSFLNNNKFTSYSINNTRGYAFRSSVFVIDNFGNTSARDWRDWFTTQNGRKLVKAQPIDTFGEYKLSLDEVQYLQCVDGQRIQQKPYPRICEVDFSVTKPYTIQKTPSGTIKKTTTDLDKFYMYAD